MTANHALQANGGGPSRLPSARIGAAVAELTSEVIQQGIFFRIFLHGF